MSFWKHLQLQVSMKHHHSYIFNQLGTVLTNAFKGAIFLQILNVGSETIASAMLTLIWTINLCMSIQLMLSRAV